MVGRGNTPIQFARRYDNTLKEWVPVSFMRRYDNNLKKWVDCLNEYEFLYYEHESPGGAVEVISSDGSMVTITAPGNNFGGSGFKFKSSVPSDAVGKDLTISMSVKASYSGTLDSGCYVDVLVRSVPHGLNSVGTVNESDTFKSLSYTLHSSNVSDNIELWLSCNEFYVVSSGTYTFAIKDVLINGKPCKFNFK